MIATFAITGSAFALQFDAWQSNATVPANPRLHLERQSPLIFRVEYHVVRLTFLDPVPVDALGGGKWLGLLYNGCQVAVGPAVLDPTAPEARLVTTFNGSGVLVNGYFLAVEGDDRGATRVSLNATSARWLLEASSDRGDSWAVVGASAWRVDIDGGVTFYPKLTWQPPANPDQVSMVSLVAAGLDSEAAKAHMLMEEAEIVFLVDHRLGWMWICAWNAPYLLGAIAMVACFVAARAARPQIAKRIWIIAMAGRIALLSAAAAGFFASGLRREALSALLCMPELAVLLVVLGLFERYFVKLVIVYGLVGVLCAFLRDALVYEFNMNLFLSELFTNNLLTVGAPLFGLAILAVRRSILHRARNLVRRDIETYDTCWAAVLAVPEAADWVLALRYECTRLQRLCPNRSLHPRQLSPKRCLLPEARKYIFSHSGSDICKGDTDTGGGVGVLLKEGGGRGLLPAMVVRQSSGWVSLMERGIMIQQPVRSLDMLFAQATLLHPLLRSKVCIPFVRRCVLIVLCARDDHAQTNRGRC